jgi:hypothetical protein
MTQRNAGPGDAQANGITDGHRLADPGILNEVLLVRGRRDHDVGTKARDLEAPLRIELVQPVERGGGQQMHHGTVEERPLGKGEVGHGVPVLESFQVGPILLGVHGTRGAAAGGIQRHRTAQRP